MIARSTAPILLLLLVVGCGERAGGEREVGERDSVQREVVRDSLPAGRYHLPSADSLLPDLFVSLPDGFVVKSASSTEGGDYFLMRPDDPSLSDPKAVTPGFLRITFGPPASPLAPPTATERHALLLAGRPVEWRFWHDSAMQFREIYSAEFFRTISPDVPADGGALQLYVAGSDTAMVARLVRVAETVSPTR